MSNLNQFMGGTRPPKLIINGCSDGGVSVGNLFISPIKSILSGAMTAATLKSLLSVTGAGAIKYLAAFAGDATSRTIRMKITIDGVVVFDATSGAITNINYGVLAIGGATSSAAPVMEAVPFNSSLLVEVASSLSETDKISLGVIYETR